MYKHECSPYSKIFIVDRRIRATKTALFSLFFGPFPLRWLTAVMSRLLVVLTCLCPFTRSFTLLKMTTTPRLQMWCVSTAETTQMLLLLISCGDLWHLCWKRSYAYRKVKTTPRHKSSLCPLSTCICAIRVTGMEVKQDNT